MGQPSVGPIGTIWPFASPPATGTSGSFPVPSVAAAVYLSTTSSAGAASQAPAQYTLMTVNTTANQSLSDYVVSGMAGALGTLGAFLGYHFDGTSFSVVLTTAMGAVLLVFQEYKAHKTPTPVAK